MDKPKFVYVTYINSTPEKVFAALTDPDMTKDYWGMHRNVSDWKPGSPWTHEDYETGVADVSGVVVECDPPRKLVLTWESAKPEFRDAQPSRVTFLIEPFMGAVTLTMTHEDLEPDSPMFHGVSQGWPAIASSLKSMLETGSALGMTKHRWKGPPKHSA